MQIEVVTHYYNEDKLASLFFKTYAFADRIHVFLDSDSSEESKQILNGYKNKIYNDLNIISFSFSDGMNDLEKVQRLNRYINDLQCNWVINVDFDEFIFTLPSSITIRNFLIEHSYADIIYVKLWQIYRHVTDKDLNYNNLHLNDRCHGDPDLTSRKNRPYVKPIVIRPNIGIEWRTGNHIIQNQSSYIVARDCLYGAHWAMADPELAIERRYYGRTLRQSQFNLKKKLSTHLHHLTPESIISECKMHENDPQLFRV